MFPVDKLQIIQDALALTKNSVPNAAADGSNEYNIASTAYEAALPYAIEGHDWKYATTVAVLVRSPTAPTDPLFNTALIKPPDLLHLIWVRLNDQPVDYQILDNQVVVNAVATDVVTSKYVRDASITAATPTFAMGLRALVMSGIYSGLNGNFEAARALWKDGEGFLAKARTRSDQEAPKRAMFNSRITAARRIRRPYPPSPYGWTGTGSGG